MSLVYQPYVTTDLRVLLDPIPDAAYNCRDSSSKCLPGTRQEIVARIMAWSDEGSGAPVCWLSGPAGFGKSALTHTIAELLAVRHRLAASFFFFRGTNRSSIARFIPTLAYQLSISVPATAPFIEHVLQRETFISHQSPEQQLTKLVIEPLLALGEAVDRMVFVIDALDECDDKDLIAELIESIMKIFQTHHVPLRFFMTSRVEEHIWVKLEDSVAPYLVFTLAIEDFEVCGNIHLFLRTRFSAICREKN
jgi:hypothetical protein